MKIKTLSKQVNVSPHTLRYYEKIGLITPRRRENNYREFTEEHIFILKLIGVLQYVSFDLNSIKQIVRAWYSEPSEECNITVNKILEDKTFELKEMIKQYRKVITLLDRIPKPETTEIYQENQTEIQSQVMLLVNEVYDAIGE